MVWKIVAQRHAGLVIAAAAVVLAALVLAIGLGLPVKSEARDSTVVDIRIDDEGVRVDNKRIELTDSLEGVVHEREGGDVRLRVTGKDLVKFGDDVIVEEGEVVQGDAVAILGSVIVNGVVEGDAVAVGGGLSVGDKGRVDGDGVAIGGGVDKEPDGVIKGQMVSIGKGGRWFGGKHVGGKYVSHTEFFPFGIFSRAGRLFLSIMWMLLLILLALVVTAVARRPVENICMKAKHEAFKMGLIGLLTEVLVLPVIVLFCITIIGIPIGLVAIPLVFGLAMLLGYTGIGLAMGERFAGGGNGRSPYWSVAMGILLLQALAIISAIVRLPGGPIAIIGWVIAFIAWAVIYVAGTVGLGAVVMTRFGTRAHQLAKVEGTAGPTGTVPQTPAGA